MKADVMEIRGWSSAICSLYHSKRSITPMKKDEIVNLTNRWTSLLDGSIKKSDNRLDKDYTKEELESCNLIEYINALKESRDKFLEMLDKVFKYGTEHTTLLRFIDFSCSVYGLHRGAQDDFDAHAERLDNRIVRSSTRLGKFTGTEKSDYYKGKILTTDQVCNLYNVELPPAVMKDGETYIKTEFGYINQKYKDEQDVKRGLYPLSIPSDFVFKCDIVEFAHIVKLRDKNGHAHPELQEMIEQILVQLEGMSNGYLTRELFYKIPN